MLRQEAAHLDSGLLTLEKAVVTLKASISKSSVWYPAISHVYLGIDISFPGVYSLSLWDNPSNLNYEASIFPENDDKMVSEGQIDCALHSLCFLTR